MQEADPRSGAGLARRLRLQQLAIFVRVLEAGSVLAASRDLAMTQPAISKSIQDLEDQIGMALFERTKRGMRLTGFGEVFETHARMMLSQLRYLSEDLVSWKTGVSGHLVVGTLIAASGTIVPRALGHLRRMAPDLKVTIKVGSNSTLFPMLLKGEVDIVLGILPENVATSIPEQPGSSPLKHVALYEDGLNVVLAAGHPLAARPSVSLAQLHGLAWIIPTQDSANYRAAQDFFTRQKYPIPERVIESVSILTNLELILQWDMVAIMPRSAARRFEALGLVKTLAFDNFTTATTIGYTVRADREQSATVQNFIRVLHDPSTHSD